MHNTEEKFVVTAGLACLCAVGAVAAVVPEVGYVLLGLVVVGMAGLIALGVVLWWGTRFQPDNQPRRASQDVAARARQAQHEIVREVA